MKNAKSSKISSLIDTWRDIGIETGDMLLVHSSLKRTLRNLNADIGDVTPGDILQSFQEALGEKGTLILPAFNYGFARGEPFDIRNNPSLMGVLTETARQAPGAVRTGHPIFSFIALGADSGRFRDLDNYSAFGPDSPFAIIKEMNGKIAVLDVRETNSLTFYHYVEECHEVPYRYHKVFRAPYKSWNGKTEVREYGFFVRDLEKKVVADMEGMGEMLWEKGLYTGCRPGTGCGLRVVSAKALFDVTTEVIHEGRAEGMLFHYET